MQIRDFKYFLKVAEIGSVSAAALELRIAQPALSRILSRLADELGVKLFVRSGRGVRLTEDGQYLREHAGAIIQQIEAVEQQLRSRSSEPHGDLSVGMPPSLSAKLTEIAIERFHKRHPDVSLRVIEATSSDLRERMQAGSLDAATITTLEPERDLDLDPLLVENLFVIGPASAGLEAFSSIQVKDLQELPLILTDHRNTMRLIVERAFSKAKLRPNIVLETNTWLVTGLVKRGMGFAILPESALEHFHPGTDISAAPVEGLTVSWTFANVRERSPSASTRAYRDILREILDEQIGAGNWKTASRYTTSET